MIQVEMDELEYHKWQAYRKKIQLPGWWVLFLIAVLTQIRLVEITFHVNIIGIFGIH